MIAYLIFLTIVFGVLAAVAWYLASEEERYLADYPKYQWCACRKIDPSELVEDNTN